MHGRVAFSIFLPCKSVSQEARVFYIHVENPGRVCSLHTILGKEEDILSLQIEMCIATAAWEKEISQNQL
jgi:hypothetical protein